MKCEKKGCEAYDAVLVHAAENIASLCPKHSREWILYVSKKEEVMQAGDSLDAAKVVLAALKNSVLDSVQTVYDVSLIQARRATAAQLVICKELHKWISEE